MRNTLDRRAAALRVLVTGTVIAGLASCGGSSPYAYNAPNSVVIADFNGDGFNDIAIATAYVDQTSTTEQPGFVSLALQNSSSPGSFQGTVHFATDGNPSAMAVGDIAGGGSKDLAVANFNKGTISVLLQTAPNSGTFKSQISLPTGGLPNDVAICDVYGNGSPALLVANGDYNGGSLVMIPQTAPGQFGAATTVGSMPIDTTDSATVPDPAYGVACGNLNGDGHSIDVVVTSFYQDLSSGYTFGAGAMVTVFLHDPSHPGQFLPNPLQISLQGILHRVAIADINGDGLPDIVVANEGAGSDGYGTPGAAVLLQNTPAGATTPTFATPVTIPTDSAVSIAVGDLNGDGLPDIAIASGYANADSVEVMFNTTPKGSSTISFSAVLPYTGLGNPSSVAIGDLNHDGLPDIASSDGTGAVIYLQQSGSAAGTFAQSIQIGS